MHIACGDTVCYDRGCAGVFDIRRWGIGYGVVCGQAFAQGFGHDFVIEQFVGDNADVVWDIGGHAGGNGDWNIVLEEQQQEILLARSPHRITLIVISC